MTRIGSPNLYSGLSFALEELKSKSIISGKHIHHFAYVIMVNNGQERNFLFWSPMYK